MMKNYQAHKELITDSIALLLSDMSEVPTKCIAVTVTLDVNASIQYIDFEGRTDGESMRKILAQIKPRQLVSPSTAAVQSFWNLGSVQHQLF